MAATTIKGREAMMRQLAAKQNAKAAKAKAHPEELSEHRIQVSCCEWFRVQHPSMTGQLFAVPNGEKRETVTKITRYGVKTWCPSGQRLKDEGVISGVSDMILLHRNTLYGALCIEIKTGKGRQSEDQYKWQQVVEKAGYKYVICRSLDEFIEQVQNYLMIP